MSRNGSLALGTRFAVSAMPGVGAGIGVGGGLAASQMERRGFSFSHQPSCGSTADRGDERPPSLTGLGLLVGASRLKPTLILATLQQKPVRTFSPAIGHCAASPQSRCPGADRQARPGSRVDALGNWCGTCLTISESGPDPAFLPFGSYRLCGGHDPGGAAQRPGC